MMRGWRVGPCLLREGRNQSVRFSPRPAGAYDEADPDADEDDEEGEGREASRGRQSGRMKERMRGDASRRRGRAQAKRAGLWEEWGEGMGIDGVSKKTLII